MQLTGYFYGLTGERCAQPWEPGIFPILPNGCFGEFIPRAVPCTGGIQVYADDGEYFYLPPLADLHAHVGVGKDGSVLDAAGTKKQLLAHRNTGVLLIRDAGVAHPPLAEIRSDPTLPEVIHCGRHLALYKRYLPNLPLVLDSPNDLPQAVYEQAKISDGWVKIVADWIDRSLGADADLLPLWQPEILREAVAAAHQAGALHRWGFLWSAIWPFVADGS